MAGQDRGGNEGFSGTPLWKIKEQSAQLRAQWLASQVVQEENERQPAEPPNVIVDAVSSGGPSDGKQNPLVRHVLVKDVNKIASRLKVSLPKTLVFKDKAPMGLYALFDAQSCAGPVGPGTADFSARNFHLKLLENLSMLPPEQSNETFVKAALIKSFEDLDRDILRTQPDVSDGCGAAVALLIGGTIFTAVLGRCSVVLGEMSDRELRPVAFGGNQAHLDGLEERRRLFAAGAMILGEGLGARIQHPSGALSRVSRSLGDRAWKGTADGGAGAPLISCVPEVHSTVLKGSEHQPFLLLIASPVADTLSAQQLVDCAGGFQLQPRAACGEILSLVQEALTGVAPQPQSTAVEVCFLPTVVSEDDKKKTQGASGAGAEAAPPAKKAKTVAAKDGARASVRLRHILVKYHDSSQPPKVDAKGRQVTRTRQEAEAILRGAIRELRRDLSACKRRPKDPNELIALQSKKFAELCRELSDCETARKGGTMCGDLGWLMPDSLLKMGRGFKENVDLLRPGQWSDITSSDQGVHLVQKIA